MKPTFSELAKLKVYNEGDLQIPYVFLNLYNTIPNEYRYDISCNIRQLKDLLQSKYTLEDDSINTCEIIDEHCPSDNHITFILFLKNGFILEISNSRITFYFNSTITIEERTEIIDIAKTFKIQKEDKKYFHMVSREYNSLDLKDFEVKEIDIDIEKHYNDDFIEIDSIIKSSLNDTNKNGMILLHGLYGTGKTYYLRHLISTLNRKFIYFPLYMIDAISSPEFLPFISEHPNSILILEDCENLLVHRDNGNGNSNALSNLLNLGDGLLSDALSVNVICTFNANIKKIDDALLRKGRMIARYEFKELALDKTKALALSLGKTLKEDKPLALADIFNAENKDFQNSKQKQVGFSVLA
jgi:hypothetical protein